MQNQTVGILAHVDAGKTTLCEQLLYHTHKIRTRGRVDHQSAFLDISPIEKERGITIFSDQATFPLTGRTCYLLDTPGHADFSAEMERAVLVMDYAVVVISCVEGVQGHTETVWKLLQKHHVPAFFFLNKTDQAGADPEAVMTQLRETLSPDCVFFEAGFSDGVFDDALSQMLCERNESLLERYFNETLTQDFLAEQTTKMILERRLFPCFSGSALHDTGVAEFLQALDRLTGFSAPPGKPFSGQAYKIRHDSQGSRLTFLKILSGELHIKNSCFVGKTLQKINEIRIYHGAKYKNVSFVSAGDLCAVTGLTDVLPGDGVGENREKASYALSPLLSARVLYPLALSPKTVLSWFRILEEEDPMLAVNWEETLCEIHVRIMGEIQLEVLKKLISIRFGGEISFGPCEILYKETIAAEVMGYGHFEPLRHYAEVHLLLSPGKRGSGIVFESTCSGDVLDQNYQNLVRTHVFEKTHKGILTCSPLTDLKMTLVTGRAHHKHTDGGDFREATFRAIRQGLFSAKNILLEPLYRFEITVELCLLGRVLSDLQKRFSHFDPPAVAGEKAIVKGRGPVAALMDYPAVLTAFTRGKGNIFLAFDGYDLCHNEEEVITRKAYEKMRDMENTPNSLFCSHGTGFCVTWEKAKQAMHCK